MSYSTSLYLIDLEVLRSSLGSKDTELLNRVRRECFPEPARPAGRAIHVEIDESGTLSLEGSPSSIDELRRAIASLTEPGDRIRYHSENPAAAREVFPQMSEAVMAVWKAVERAPSIDVCPRGEVWEAQSPAPGDERDRLDAVQGLIFGDAASQDAAATAYALEALCRTLGSRFDDGDTLGALSDLGLDSPLEERRMPGNLPTPEDFPIVGYLTFVEVKSEQKRLDGLDLAHPDEAIELARKALFACVKRAARRKQGLVAFCY